jgi:hypothetical protein
METPYVEPDPDAERWRFLADHKLTLLHTAGGDCRVNLVRSGEPPKILPVSTGPTAESAIDSARARYEYALDQRNHLRKPL